MSCIDFLKDPFFLSNDTKLYPNFSFWKETDIQPNIPYILLCAWFEMLVDLQLLITLTYICLATFGYYFATGHFSSAMHCGADIDIVFGVVLYVL